MLFVLVGPTRAGKSTFINTILGRQVAEEGASKSFYSTTREIANYCELTANSTHQKVLNSCIPNDGNTQLILNFMDTIGLGDVKVEYTDEEIQELVKAELIEKTLCTKIDAVLLFENPNSPSIQINQTYLKITNIFGPTVAESTIVVIP